MKFLLFCYYDMVLKLRAIFFSRVKFRDSFEIAKSRKLVKIRYLPLQFVFFERSLLQGLITES